jgi:putative transposase
LVLVKPETVIGWHRKGFQLFWTWKVRHGQPGRPPESKEIRQLIRKISRENPLWGAPRIHGELLKLGIDIGQTSVGNYIVRSRKPPSQTFCTFLENHVKTMVSVDFFTVPTIRFQVLYVFLVLAHDRRRTGHFNVTAHPTTEWTAQQLREAFPFDQIPRYLLPDRDRIFGDEFTREVKAMATRLITISFSPRLVASIESEREFAAVRILNRIRNSALWRVSGSATLRAESASRARPDGRLTRPGASRQCWNSESG